LKTLAARAPESDADDMTRSIAAIVAALAAATILALSATPASATTWHHATEYFHFVDPADASAIMPRTLNLNGRYRWRAFTAHWAHENQPTARSRTLGLHGRYRWDDYMQVQNGRWVHTSALTNLGMGGQVTICYAPSSRYGDGTTVAARSTTSARADHPRAHRRRGSGAASAGGSR
jgi:hypothetical protein